MTSYKKQGDKLVSTSIQLSAGVKNWVGDGLPDQVRGARGLNSVFQ